MSKDVAVGNNEIVQQVDIKTITDYLDSTGLTNRLLPNEKTMFVNIAQLFGLNPFKREIYCNVYGEGQYRQCSIITGYEVYLKRAERLHLLDGWEVSIEGNVKDGTLSATVTIYRKDWTHPFRHTALYSEVKQVKKDGTPNRFWQTQPTFMTRKVAVAQAFRLCFPDEFGGMPYTNDELGLDLPKEKDITDEATVDLHKEPVKQINSDRKKLTEILNKYEKDFDKAPYEMCANALAGGDDADVRDKLDRAIAYLGRKGIQVA